MLMPLASLRITVTLLVLSMILVFVGTLAQVDAGIWYVQKRYFHAVWTWVDFALFFPRPTEAGQKGIGGGFPMPGGYLLGLLLLINLAAAYVTKFRLSWKDVVLLPALAVSLGLGYLVLGHPPFAVAVQSALGWEKGGVYYLLCLFAPVVLAPILLAVLPLHKKRTGIILIHMGILLLLVGEGITSRLQREHQMVIDEGQTARFVQDSRKAELAITDTSPADHDEAVLVPQGVLEKKGVVRWAPLPFDLRIDEYYPNSQLLGPMQAGENKPRATAGIGTKVSIAGVPKFTGTEAQNIDMPGGYVTLLDRQTGAEMGTYLLSSDSRFPTVSGPQEFQAGGKTYTVQLRYKREYKPYAFTLIDFAHDVYTGTNRPKNYSSRVRITDPGNKVDREVLIRMNEPLRYAGETFYQSSFMGETTTVLQVVRNPGWLMPYVACTVGGAGLTLHFGITLLNFLRKQKKREVGGKSEIRNSKSETNSKGEIGNFKTGMWAWVVPGFVVAVFAIYVLSKTMPEGGKSAFDLGTFARVPLSFEGRTMPMDSLARNSLKVLAERERVKVDGKTKAPAEWLLDMLAKPEDADKYPVFRIDNHEVQALVRVGEEAKFYSWEQFRPHFKDVEREFERTRSLPAKQRGVFEKKILDFSHKLEHYIRLGRQAGMLYFVPPAAEGQDWRRLGDVLAEAEDPERVTDPAAANVVKMLRAYRAGDAPAFNAAVAGYERAVAEKAPKAVTKARFETWFNHFDPFMQCMAMYVVVFVLAVCSWVGWSRPLARAAFWLLGLTLLVHTFGLIGRVYISGRPPVTNLASSAIFIAWGGVLLAAALEWVHKNAVGSVSAAAIGFTSLLISDQLALSRELSPNGDTMEVLQAVLDTNFWLATHVVTITLGYAATFLAGLIAIIFVVRGLFTSGISAEDTKASGRMIYGVVCFAALFSFVGTVLGGIWADQSWGRFWGWDPKENGAVLIVLWNAAILHARWGGIVRERGLALMAIFGNVVTAWSWFGTNMLGVGLHSYGFMDSAMYWLLVFVASQVTLIAAGLLPLRFWRSFGPTASPA
jgi:ABC-type transport system involved in cytochrome c biogenesis permease subunit